MKNIFTTVALCLVCAFGVFAQNYTTVQITPVNGVLTVNGVDQISIPNFDPSEVQLEPLSGFVAVPSSDQMYTVAEYASLDDVLPCLRLQRPARRRALHRAEEYLCLRCRYIQRSGLWRQLHRGIRG